MTLNVRGDHVSATASPLHPDPSQAAPGPGVSPMGVSDLVGLFQRRWRLLLAVGGLVLLTTVIVTLLLTPIYTATAEIKIDPTQRSPVDFDAAVRNAAPDQALIDTEAAVMHSRTVAAAVVNRLHLIDDPEFGPHRNLLMSVLTAGLPVAGPGPSAEPKAIERVLKRLKVEREGSTYIVDMSFGSTDPDKAARIANAFAEEYSLASLKARVDTATQQSLWLNQRMSELGGEVQAADEAVARYRAEHGIATGGAGATVTDQQIGALTTQLATAESDAAAANSNLQAARAEVANGSLDSISTVLNSPVIGDLRKQRADILRTQAEISTRYGPNHPETLKVQQQLDGIDRQIKEEAERTLGGLESTARAATAREQSLRAEVAALGGQQATNVRATVEADSLVRTADAKRAMYNQLAQTAQQANQQEHFDTTESQVIVQATAPIKASFPNKTLFLALGAMLGLVSGVAAVLIAEALDAGVRTVEDVENQLGATFIESLPNLTPKQLRNANGGMMKPWDYVNAKPMSAYAEALRNTRNALILANVDKPPKVIVVTSALPGEGKTSTAAALSRVMGMSGEKVVLVDCDLRLGALAALLPTRPKVGLIEMLIGEATLDSVIQHDVTPGMDIIPLAKSTFTPRDLFGSNAMQRLLEELSSRYDHVVLDAPPVLAVADARTLAVLADTTLVTIRWRRTPRQATRAALARLKQDGAHVSGVLLSMVDPRAPSRLNSNDSTYYYGASGAYYQE